MTHDWRGPAENLPSERKFVTLLRADLHRSTDLVSSLELEDAIARLEPALGAMRDAVQQHGGIVWRELGDGIIAVFGAPLAEAQHAVLACHAALDLVRRIQGLEDAGIRVRVGVHTDFVIAGMVQTGFSPGYEIGGPALILAERLQAIAEPGQVLVSAACHALARGTIDFAAPRQHALKGYAEPVTVHAAAGIVAGLDHARTLDQAGVVATGDSDFVGRAAELDALLDAADTAAAGHGQVAVITGEPGVGKSRLAHELVDTLRRRDWQTIRLECNAILGHSPFGLLRGLLAALRTCAEARGVDPLTGLSALQRSALATLDVVPAAVPAWIAPNSPARAKAVIDAVRALVASVASEQPMLILIEDLQWADEASMPAFDTVARSSATLPLLIMATARPGGVPAWLAQRLPLTLDLPPLGDAAARALLDRLLGRSPPLHALKARILGHTGRLPLFIVEVCRRLIEIGVLQGEWGDFRLTRTPDALDVPPTLQGVIASRIDRLSPADKRVLQMAAGLGLRWPLSLLRDVVGLSATALAGRLRSLAAASLLLPAETAAEPTFEFPHELIRQVAYDAMLTPVRASLHGRVLTVLEAGPGYCAPEFDGARVHHALLAKAWDRAADHAAIIARRSLAQSALADATRYYEVAMGAVDRLPATPMRETLAIDLRIEARVAYGNTGKVERWLSLGREAEARARVAGDRMRQVAALAVSAAALNFYGPATEALTVGREAVLQATALGDPGWLGYAEYVLGQACFVSGRLQEAAAMSAQSADRFLHGGAQPPIGAPGTHLVLLCSMMETMSHAEMGDAESAGRSQAQTAALAARSGVPFDRIAAGLGQGLADMAAGRPAAAEVALAASLALARQHEVHLFVPVVACQLGIARLRLGQRDEGRAALLVARAQAETLGYRSVALRSTIHLAASAPPGQDLAYVLDDLRAAAQTARQQGYEAIEAEARLTEAALLLEGAEVDGAVILRQAHYYEATAKRLGAVPLLLKAQALVQQAAKLEERDLLSGDRGA